MQRSSGRKFLGVAAKRDSFVPRRRVMAPADQAVVQASSPEGSSRALVCLRRNERRDVWVGAAKETSAKERGGNQPIIAARREFAGREARSERGRCLGITAACSKPPRDPTEETIRGGFRAPNAEQAKALRPQDPGQESEDEQRSHRSLHCRREEAAGAIPDRGPSDERHNDARVVEPSKPERDQPDNYRAEGEGHTWEVGGVHRSTLRRNCRRRHPLKDCGWRGAEVRHSRTAD